MRLSRGFSLLEVIVATAVLGGTLAIVTTFMTHLTRAAADQRRYSALLGDANRWTNKMANSLSSAAIIAEDAASITYQVPVDPDGNGPMQDLDGDGSLDVLWGARRSDGDHAGQATVILFVVTGTFSEETVGIDANGDDDKTDVFDVGHLEEMHYDSVNATEQHLIEKFVITKDVILFGDVDGDGQADPLFSRDGDGRRLWINFFVSDLHEERPTFVRSSTVIPLHNRML